MSRKVDQRNPKPLTPRSSLVFWFLDHLLKPFRQFHFWVKMLKFLSRVKIEFNALDPRTASCMEFLAQCNSRKAKESNPACEVLVKRRTDEYTPQITVTFVNGVEEVFDATSTAAQNIRSMILEKGQLLETEQMFREAGESWPVIIPQHELTQPAPGTKVRFHFSFLFFSL